MTLTREYHDGIIDAKAEVNCDGIRAQIRICVKQASQTWGKADNYVFSRLSGATAAKELLEFADYVCNKCVLNGFAHHIEQGILHSA